MFRRLPVMKHGIPGRHPPLCRIPPEMFIIPYSTDVHDGTIRLAALEIIGICLLVHLFVSADQNRIRDEAAGIIEKWQQERIERLYRRSRSGNDRNVQVKEVVRTVNGVSSDTEELRARLMEVRKTSLMYRLGLVLDDFHLHTLFTSMFTHGGWFHLIGNMLLFYVCGLAMEQYWGYWKFLIIYIGCGVAAAGTFAGTVIASNADMHGIPLVGASGAIAGIMGAFLVTHTRVRVKLFYALGFWFRGVLALPAWIYFGFWFLQQVAAALLDANHSSGVAYTAHIGGFVVGGLLGNMVKSDDDAAVVDPELERIRNRKEKNTASAQMSGGFYYAPATTVEEALQEEDEPVEPPSVAGTIQEAWEMLDRGEKQSARQKISQAIFICFQSFEHHRALFNDLFSEIVGKREQLEFSQNEYYQWGKQLQQLGETRYAIISFDLAAFTGENNHIRNNSLLASARLRMNAGMQCDRVQRDMEFLQRIDPGGIAGGQAAELLEQVRGN